MDKKSIAKKIKQILIQNKVPRAYLFGSFTKKKSYHDIDIAIDPPENFSLLDLSRLAIQLELKIGTRVDIVTLRALHPEIKKAIANELIAI